MTSTPPSDPRADGASPIGCRECGHTEWTGHPRLAVVLHPLALFLWPLAVVALVLAPSPWSWLPALAALALAAFARLGGVHDWGGARCRRCGATEMLR